MTQEGEEENCSTPSDDCEAPHTSKAEKSFRIVEKAINATIGWLLQGLEKEVTIEPTELAELVVNADDSPQVQRNQGCAEDVSKKRHSVRPVCR